MSYSIAPGAYTLLGRRMAVSGGLDVEKAVKYLKEDARLRSVRETLIRCSDTDTEDSATLKDSIASLLRESDSNAKKNAIDKNVSNWLADDVQTISKDYAIQLAYALHMPVEYADAWLTRLCGEAFHWRNPEDIVWVYGLINGLSYAEAKELRERLKGKGLLDTPDTESKDVMTALVRQTVAQLNTEAKLDAFLADAKGQLGTMHNTAYGYFMAFMDLLQNPADHSYASMTREEIEKNRENMRKFGDDYKNDAIPEDKEMSVRDVITEYLYRKYIPRMKRRGKGREDVGNAVHSAIQRSIAKNWPEETTLSRMKNREADITRKVLILLFLATDGEGSEYVDMDVDADEDFESMEARMNLMLAKCGFAQLDSRTPFDWMVLYCMYADESIFIEENMRSFLESVFKG